MPTTEPAGSAISLTGSATEPPAAPPTVRNTSFQRPVLAVGGFAYDPAGADWVYSGGSGVSANGSGFTAGNPGAPQGSQVGFIQGRSEIAQSVAGWASGSYAITFDAARRANFGGVQDFEVTVDGSVVGTFSPASKSYQSYATPTFSVAAGTHKIAFIGLDTAGGDATDFIDRVALEQAPAVSQSANFTYAWSVTKDGATYASGSGSSFSFTPDDMGTYAASLVATDQGGVSGTPATATIGVTDATPTATISGAPSTVATGTAIAVAGAATDPAAAVAAAGYSLTWSAMENGTAIATGSGANFDFTPNVAGSVAISLVATDKNGTASVPATATVHVVASPQTPQESLLYSSNVQYVGAFRVPNYYNSTDQMSYANGTLAFNPSDNSLFIVGSNQSISEISIPRAIVNSTNLDSLSTASILQPWTNVLGALPNQLGQGDGGPIGGLVVDNGQLIGTQYSYYTGANIQTASHFVLNSTNLATAQGSGLFQIGGASPGARYLAGYMAAIPSGWQAALGAPYLTGLSDVPIIGTTSSGPSAFGFDPSLLSSGNAQATPYLYYPSGAPLGAYSGPANPMQSGTTQIGGVAFPAGTGSVLYFGRTGTNYEGYGLSGDYGDPYDFGKGPHSLDGQYSFQIWAYRASDFAAVKAGGEQPDQVLPYDVWNLSFPINAGEQTVGGVAYDQSTGRLYVSLLNADSEASYSSLPLIEVFQVNAPSASQPPAAPQIGTLAATPSTIAPGAIPAGTPTTVTAGNVYALSANSSIASVSFWLVSDGGTTPDASDKLLGKGTGAANMPDGSSTNWTLAIDTTGLAPGNYTLVAQAVDSGGQLSNLVETTMVIGPAS